MKKLSSKIFIILCFSLAFFNQSFASNSISTSFDSFEVKTVLKDEFINDTYRGLVTFDYCLFTPVSTGNSRLPLILILEPSDSQSEFDSVIQRTRNILLAQDFRSKNNSYALIVRLPSRVDAYSMDDYNSAFISMIDKLVTGGKVDRNRIYAYTSGSGSDTIYNAIAKNSLYFTAVTIINGNPQNLRVEVAKNLPINIFQSFDNPAFSGSLSAYNRFMDMNNRYITYNLYANSTSLNSVKSSEMKNHFNWMYQFVKQRTFVLPSGRDGRLFANGKTISIVPKRINGNTLVSLPEVTKALGYAIEQTANKDIYEITNGANKILVDLKDGRIYKNNAQESERIPTSPHDMLIRPDFFTKYLNSNIKINNTGAGYQVTITSN